MSYNISLSIRRLAVMSSALVGMTACQDANPTQPLQKHAAASAPSGTKLVPQFNFHGILFIGNQDDFRGEVYAMNADGTNIVRLTADDSVDSYPDISPASPSFVWVRNLDWNRTEIYSQNLDGTNRKRLTNSGSVLTRPRFSPDGTKIAYIDMFDTSGPEIHVMNADGSNPHRVSNTGRNIQSFAWSPDGSKMAYTANNDSLVQSIWTMNSDGTNRKMILSCPAVNAGCGDVSWSPVANEIAFEYNDFKGIFAINATTGAEVGYIPNPLKYSDFYPVWSSDGKKIIFVSTRSNNNGFDLFQTSLVRGPLAQRQTVQRLTSIIGYELMPSYSRY